MGLRPANSRRRWVGTSPSPPAARSKCKHWAAADRTGQHIAPVGSHPQLCDLAEVQPRLRLRARLVRELAARSRPSRRRQPAGTISSPRVPSSATASACRAGAALRPSPTSQHGSLTAQDRLSHVGTTASSHPQPAAHRLRRHAHGGGRCTRWRRRSAAAASRLTCRCLRPASGESASFRSKRCDTPTPRHPGLRRLGFEDSGDPLPNRVIVPRAFLQIREHVRTTSSTRTGLKKDVGKTSKVVALQEKTSKVGTIL